jgi:murein DD-endopeptidase MepM/ murein hydrolase activator NlpD
MAQIIASRQITASSGWGLFPMLEIFKRAGSRRHVQAIVRPALVDPHVRTLSRVKFGFAALILGGGVAAFGIAPFAPDISHQPKTLVTEPVALIQAQGATDGQSAQPESEDAFVREARVERGDTLSALFTKLGVQDEEAAGFARSDAVARKLLDVRPGKRITAVTDEEGELRSLRALLAADDSGARMLWIDRTEEDKLISREMIQPYERRVEMRSGQIVSSLFGAMDGAGVPDNVTQQMVNVLSSEIDFYNDLRRGDQFRVVYEMLALPSGETPRAGRLLALEFKNGSRLFQAVWFGTPGSNNPNSGNFYTFDGKSLRKAFLRTPVEFTRVSSGFGSRSHPIFGYTRQHTGIDFAAPHGTRIMAASDGVVQFAGVQRGYGNVVILEHQGRVETLYAHMSGFAPGIQKGARVAQGDIIGFVGSTGWSTGPHLHYEYHVNDVPVNPATVALPDAEPIAPNYWGAFTQKASDMQRRMRLMTDESRYAAAE